MLPPENQFMERDLTALQKGLQRRSRFRANQAPFQAPYLQTASYAYCEQVGINRHFPGK